MSKMNTEVMEQWLKDLAANIGYDLISEPFYTPFEKVSGNVLPDAERFLWPVPASVLNDEEHKEFRKMCIRADIIDTVCTTSFSWPSKEDDHIAILLIDVTRRRRGSIKFVDATLWKNLSDETDMAAICNLLIHDVFPGEYYLAFQMDEDAMDLGLDDRWSDQVRIVASWDIGNSLLPKDYLLKPVAKKGFEYVRLDDIFSIEDSFGAKISQGINDRFFNETWWEHEFIVHDDTLELKVPAITVSIYGDLQPQKVSPGTSAACVDLTKSIILIPQRYTSYDLDLDYLLEQMDKESTIRQLPFFPNPNIPLEKEHLKGILIEIPQKEERSDCNG